MNENKNIKPVETEADLDISWQDLKDLKDDTAKSILDIQMLSIELLKQLDSKQTDPEKDKDFKELILKTYGISKTCTDLAMELGKVIKEYALDGRNAMVVKDDDYAEKLECMTKILDIQDKVVAVNGTGILDIITAITDDSTLKQDSENLKSVILETLNTATAKVSDMNEKKKGE